jgi:hypothetical protein
MILAHTYVSNMWIMVCNLIYVWNTVSFSELYVRKLWIKCVQGA